MGITLKFLSTLSRLGVREELGRDVIRGIRLSNHISLLAIVVSFTLAFLHGSLVSWNIVPLISLLIGLCFLFPLYANHHGKILISRIFLSFCLPTCVIFFSVVTKELGPENDLKFDGVYYDYHFFLMVTALGTLGLFEQAQKVWSYTSAAYVAILIVLFDPLHDFFGVGYYQTGHADPHYYFTTVVVLLAYGALLTGLAMMRFDIDKNEERLLNTKSQGASGRCQPRQIGISG
jgi:hypothetical protein